MPGDHRGLFGTQHHFSEIQKYNTPMPLFSMKVDMDYNYDPHIELSIVR